MWLTSTWTTVPRKTKMKKVYSGKLTEGFVGAFHITIKNNTTRLITSKNNHVPMIIVLVFLVWCTLAPLDGRILVIRRHKVSIPFLSATSAPTSTRQCYLRTWFTAWYLRTALLFREERVVINWCSRRTRAVDINACGPPRAIFGGRRRTDQCSCFHRIFLLEIRAPRTRT